jgi:hypothetical protein
MAGRSEQRVAVRVAVGQAVGRAGIAAQHRLGFVGEGAADRAVAVARIGLVELHRVALRTRLVGGVERVEALAAGGGLQACQALLTDRIEGDAAARAGRVVVDDRDVRDRTALEPKAAIGAVASARGAVSRLPVPASPTTVPAGLSEVPRGSSASVVARRLTIVCSA